MQIKIPDMSLVMLVGASGSGKSSFARKHFKPTEVISSDHCRGLVSDDENNQNVTNEAFELLHFIAAKRLALGRIAVIDATNVNPEDRRALLALAKTYHCQSVALVFDLPEEVCHARNRQRPERDFGPHVVRKHISLLRRSSRGLKREGFRHIHIFKSEQDVDAAELERTRLWNDLRDDHGPFDIIGDVHGCFEELRELLETLGYRIERSGTDLAGTCYRVIPPAGRKAVFLGDLVDRGPDTPGVLRLVMDMHAAGAALCVPGNHDIKLLRKLRGKDVRLTHGLAESLAQLEIGPEAFHRRIITFIDGLIGHYVLDGGKLVVAHAGMKADMQGRAAGRVREFALYGETTGETDEFGLPVRYDWAAEYRGRTTVVYGHTPVAEAEWLNGTICIDTGCVFGGKLSALRYPENQVVSVPAKHVYYEPVRPFLPEQATPALSAQHTHDDMLDAADVTGRRYIHTRLRGNVVIQAGQAAAAWEVMGRFAVNPKWLIYLPPTMSPGETSPLDEYLEHPAEVFAYYRNQGVDQVICQAKHMGSRLILVLCRDEDTARRRFGVRGEGFGMCYTRTGRRFFEDSELQHALLARVRSAADKAGLWERLATDWLCLDCELMPWTAKAQSLIQSQYAAVGAAAGACLDESVKLLAKHPAAGELLARYQTRADAAARYIDAYRAYCEQPVRDVEDLKLAPFHVLAGESGVYTDKPHLWHLETIAALCEADRETLVDTEYCRVDLSDPAGEQAGTAWWEALTARGGEGMVVKPVEFIAKGRKGLIQPAVKCRGREYLRIIYGPEYTTYLTQLKQRTLGTKRSLALREFALGVEALERFVRKEPLRRVHECVFGVLALESEAVDPRL